MWSEEAEPDPARLDNVARDLKATQDGAQTLAIIEDRARLWPWLPKPVTSRIVEEVCPVQIRVAIGPPLEGLSGFRRSHERALVAQRVLAIATVLRPVASYDEVRLAAIFSERPDRGKPFIADVLGNFASASPELKKSLWTYLSLGGNMSRAAEALALHRNTLMRHLTIAEDLLPKPLDECRVEVAAALDALRWFTLDGSQSS